MKKFFIGFILLVIFNNYSNAQDNDSIISFSVVGVTEDVTNILSYVIENEKKCTYYSDTMIFYFDITELYNNNLEISVEGISNNYKMYISNEDNYCFFYGNHLIIISDISIQKDFAFKTSKKLIIRSNYRKVKDDFILLDDSYNIYVFDFQEKTYKLRNVVKRCSGR